MLHPAPPEENVVAINGMSPIYLRSFNYKAEIIQVPRKNLKHSHITPKKSNCEIVLECIILFLQEGIQEFADCETQCSQKVSASVQQPLLSDMLQEGTAVCEALCGCHNIYYKRKVN